MKIVNIEKGNPKAEILKFLLAYRTTPHTSTGASPTSMMFNFVPKSKLPSLRPEFDRRDESVRDHDWKSKLEGKKYADMRRGAKVSTVTPGEQVLLKNQAQGKLDPKFESEPYQVTSKQGSEVTVEKDGVEYRRNVAHTKSVTPSLDMLPVEPNSVITEKPLVPIGTPVRNRPQSKVKLPGKFQGFEMG